MGSRWLCAPGLLTDSTRAVYESQKEPETRAVPAITADPWRTWLMTGTRLVPLDPRRARGRASLLKTLTEESNHRQSPSERWKDLTSAMERQVIGEALNTLPGQQRQVVKLAYFGGYTNREIAERVGLPVSGVRRRLREALATVSAYVGRTRAAGSKVVCTLLAWFAVRWLGTAERSSGRGVGDMLRAGMVVAAGATASAMLGAQLVSPAQVAPAGLASVPSLSSVQASVVQAPKTTIVAAAGALPQSSLASELVQRSDLPPLPITVPVAAPVGGLPKALPGSLKAAGLPINLLVPTPAVPVLPRGRS
jgi:RNA polymerase sigma factor (sigma-70 family)